MDELRQVVTLLHRHTGSSILSARTVYNTVISWYYVLMAKTLIFLDVDGVINALSTGAPRQNTGWETWKRIKVNGFWIRYSPDLLRELESLAALPDVEVVWLTSWCNAAPTKLSRAIGFDASTWRVIGKDLYDIDPYGRGFDWWKFVALTKELVSDPDARFVWLDDDLRYERDATTWASGCGKLGLWISPNPLHGLTVKHVEAVREFVS